MQKIIRIDEKKDVDLSNGQAECYVLLSELDKDFCLHFIQEAAKFDKIVLFYGEKAVRCCIDYAADGVVVDLGEDDINEKMAELRQKLGKGKFIGLFTRNRKHESMLVSELEPDFIVFRVWKDGFDKVKELTDWYNEFFLIQSAAWIMDKDVDITVLQTDFVVTENLF